LLDKYNNHFIEKYTRLWQDPIRQDESLILFYLLAIPVGYIADVFRFRIKGIPVPMEKSRLKFEHNRPVEAEDLLSKFYPGTNFRYLAKTWSIFSLIYYVVLFLILCAIFMNW
jgi:hypothetical protein